MGGRPLLCCGMAVSSIYCVVGAVLALAALSWADEKEGERPGVRVGVAIRGLQTAADFWIPKELGANDVVIPGHVPHKGDKIGYSDIHVQHLAVGSAAVSATDAGKLFVVMDEFSASVPNTEFSVHQDVAGIHFHCHGVFSASVSSTSITLAATVANDDGKPDVRPQGHVSIGKISVKHRFHASSCRVAESIVQFFVGSITKKIESAVEDKVVPALFKALGTTIEKGLLHLAYTRTLVPGVVIDYGLSGPISLSSRGIAVGVKGSFRPPGMPVPSPFAPALMDPVDFSRDVEIEMSDSVINKASEMLAVRYCRDDVVVFTPDDMPLELEPLTKLCKSCSLTLAFSFTVAPVAKITVHQGVSALVQGAFLNISLVDATVTMPVASTFVNITASAQVGVTRNGAYVNATYSVEDLSLYGAWSSFDLPTSPEFLKFISKVVEKALIPYANDNWGWLPLPSVPNTLFRKAAVKVFDGFFAVSADLLFA